MIKARKLSHWIGLFCVAALVLMPDITVNAQPDLGGQGSHEQTPNEVGQGTDTQTSAEEQPPAEQPTAEQQGPSNEVGQGTDTQTPADQQTSEKQRKRAAEQSLIESGCQHTETSTSPMDGSVWNGYHCPPGSRFEGGEPGGLPGWICLVSPDRANAPGGIINGVVMWVEITKGECVPPLGGGGAIWEPTENGQSTREVNVKKIAEPASSDSQGESDQQQANGELAQVDEEAQDEEARGEENKASNQSQENNDPKKGYGCSANP